MQDFLIELGFEELPARFVEGAVQQLSGNIQKKLKQERLKHGEVVHYSTPRRVAVLIRGLETEQADLTVEVKGPPKKIAYDQAGQMTKAGRGFLRSQGADDSAIFIKVQQGAEYLFIKKEIRGQKTAAVLRPLLEDIIANLSFPKNMRWGDGQLRSARPLRWIACLLGREVIPLQLGALKAGRVTYGHRQLGPGQISLEKPGEYEQMLKDNYVLADAAERERLITKQIENLAKRHKAVVQEDQRLLSEVVNLVEYPTAFCGTFSPEYLELPAEVLETSMKVHQRYFPMQDRSGRLLPKFVGVRNGADNHLGRVIRGNEKVLSARLADAKFFFEEDSKIPLEKSAEKLGRVVFQEGLGSVGDKVERIRRLSEYLLEALDCAEQRETVLRTAQLAKADLVSQMVGEFPELQGVMGGIYAGLQGEAPEIAEGIKEHYWPRFAGDALPNTVEGIVVSLADKIDTLAGYFILGKIPTGSQDPFALRRQARGVVQILLQRGYSLSLRALIEQAAAGYDSLKMNEKAARSLLDFFLARLRVLFLEQGFSYDLIDAVMASGSDSAPDLQGRLSALSDFAACEGYDDLLTGCGRLANLAGGGAGEELAPGLFQPADQAFFKAISRLGKEIESKLEKHDYTGFLQQLAGFREAVDRFFDEVMIMDSDPVIRSNRLNLLQKALDLYALYGDFHLIVGNK